MGGIEVFRNFVLVIIVFVCNFNTQLFDLNSDGCEISIELSLDCMALGILFTNCK